MPPFETMDRYQSAVYWAASSAGPTGEPTLADPVELEVRWRWGSQQATAADGTPTRIDASVVLDQQVSLGSLMVQGSLADFLGTGSGVLPVEYMEVVTYKEVPDIKGVNTRYRCGLRYYRGSRPNG